VNSIGYEQTRLWWQPGESWGICERDEQSWSWRMELGEGSLGVTKKKCSAKEWEAPEGRGLLQMRESLSTTSMRKQNSLDRYIDVVV